MDSEKIKEYDDLLELEIFFELLNFPISILKDEFITKTTLLKNWGKALAYAIEEEIIEDKYYYTTIEKLEETSIYNKGKEIQGLVNEMISQGFLIADYDKYYFNSEVLDLKKFIRAKKELAQLEEIDKYIFEFTNSEWFIKEDDELFEIYTKSVIFEDEESYEDVNIASALKISDGGEDNERLNDSIRRELEEIIKVPQTINLLKKLHTETMNCKLYASAMVIREELKMLDVDKLEAIQIFNDEEYEAYFKNREKDKYRDCLELLDCSEMYNTYGWFKIADRYCSIVDVVNNDVNFEEMFWYISMILKHDNLSLILYEMATDLDYDNPLRREIMDFLGEL